MLYPHRWHGYGFVRRSAARRHDDEPDGRLFGHPEHRARPARSSARPRRSRSRATSTSTAGPAPGTTPPLSVRASSSRSIPISAASAPGLFGGGWFTFDTAAGGEDKKRWYTLTGPVTSSSATATLDIIAPTGGNFNAAPVINSGDGADNVGHADDRVHRLHARLSQLFVHRRQRPRRQYSAVATRRQRHLRSRPTAPATAPRPASSCSPVPGTRRARAARACCSTSTRCRTSRSPPGTPMRPTARASAAVRASAGTPCRSPRPTSARARSSNIGIFSAQGGLFDAAATVTTPQVGTASIVFSDCNHLALNFNFTTGTNAGQTGSVNLQRVGPTPAGCSL